MPAEPKEIQVLDAMKTFLEGVTAGDYFHTVEKVTLDEDLPFAELMKGVEGGARLQLTGLSTDEDVQRFASKQSIDFGFRIVAGIRRPRDLGAEIQRPKWRLLNDVSRALLANYSLGNLVNHLEVVQKIPFADGPENDYIGGVVLGFVTFRHSALDPYQN